MGDSAAVRPRAPAKLMDVIWSQNPFRPLLQGVKSPPGSGVTVEDMAVLAPLGCGYLTGAGTVFNVGDSAAVRPRAPAKLMDVIWSQNPFRPLLQGLHDSS
jgi:hypothetical protein